MPRRQPRRRQHGGWAVRRSRAVHQPAPCHPRSLQAAGLVYGSEMPPIILSPDGEREPALGRIEWGTTIREIEVGLPARWLASAGPHPHTRQPGRQSW